MLRVPLTVGATLVAGALPVSVRPPETLVTPVGIAMHAMEIPAFARKYRTSCSTCHTAAPKLNVLGEAFRLNGYRFPDNDKLLRQDDPVPLGSGPWKDQWPRTIWPGEIPGVIPLALRVASDIKLDHERTGERFVRLRFPDEIYLLAASTLGDNIAVFLETEWNREHGIEIVQGKLKFQNLIPALPERSLSLWVGLQNPYLFTFADRQIDRAGRLKFLWQTYRVSDVELVDPIVGDTLVSEGDFALGGTRPTLELNGLLMGRFYYGAGIAQDVGSLAEGEPRHIDGYYKVRYKVGGLGLNGRYGVGDEPVLGGGGQLLDRSVILEAFGYFGGQAVDKDRVEDHRSFGFNARGLIGPLDVGAGLVWGRDDDPWGTLQSGAVTFSSFFAKAEYLFYPWLSGSLKFDTFDARIPASVREAGFTVGDLEATRIMPGVVLLIRHNLRGVIEAELFTRLKEQGPADEFRPRNVWLRLDVAF